MDIQKEWDLFVAHLRTLGVVKIGRNALGIITNLTREGKCSLSYNDIELMWETWQAAKAQAVPEGFVLVKKELPEQIAEKMAIDRIDKPRHENDLVWREIAEQSYKDQVKSKKWEFWRDYKAMIEAQENKG